MVPIIMPQVGQDYPVGVIVEWLKNENDPVEFDVEEGDRGPKAVNVGKSS